MWSGSITWESGRGRGCAGRWSPALGAVAPAVGAGEASAPEADEPRPPGVLPRAAAAVGAIATRWTSDGAGFRATVGSFGDAAGPSGWAAGNRAPTWTTLRW